MPDTSQFALFLAAATLLAITPGPGLFYVLARSLAGGRREGVLSSVGTFCGGLVHVLAAALGVSTVLAASALAFNAVKYAGAAYLIYLGIQAIRSAKTAIAEIPTDSTQSGSLVQGIWTEVLNPKTALFFLAFIPQFISPAKGHVFLQFALLGTLSVVLNTLADLTVALFAGTLSNKLRAHPRWQQRQRLASGFGMIGLGVFVGTSGSSRAS